MNPHFKAAPLKFYLTNPLSKLIESLDNPEVPGSTTVTDFSPEFTSPVKDKDKSEIFEVKTSTAVNSPTTVNNAVNHSSLNKTVLNPLEQTNTYHKEVINAPGNYIRPILYPSSSLQKSEKADKTVKIHSPQCKLPKSRTDKTIHVIDTDSSALEDDNSETSITDKKV